jgi:hypothetical protein
MSTHAARGSRTQRTSPYIIDSLAVTFHRSAAGMAWRWRTELRTLLLTASTLDWLRATLGSWIPAGIASGLVVLALFAVPQIRRWITRRFWCVLARHRIQRLCWEARLHTRAGRLPLILWTRPTKVGERAWLLCRAGICAEDFDDHTGELRAACYARDARVTRNTRWSQLVVIDIIRRDTLAAAHDVHSPLPDLRARHLRAIKPAPEMAATRPDGRHPARLIHTPDAGTAVPQGAAVLPAPRREVTR